MNVALLVSPHLDDVAFSCGGIAARLARHNWRVVVATLFTRSVHPASGFALECQRDKGLPDDVDYMALRRAEDIAAMDELDADFVHLDFPEAPHRGYASVAALFGSLRDDDPSSSIANELDKIVQQRNPTLVLGPQGCGGHVDHLLAIKAMRGLAPRATRGFYRDTPYVIRNREAEPYVQANVRVTCPLDPEDLATKQRAACCYRSQIGFQFGGADEACVALASLAEREADGRGYAERLMGETDALLALLPA